MSEKNPFEMDMDWYYQWKLNQAKELEIRKSKAIEYLYLFCDRLIEMMVEKKVLTSAEAANFVSNLNTSVFTAQELDAMR